MKCIIWCLAVFVLPTNTVTVTSTVTNTCHKEDSLKCVIQSISPNNDQQIQLPNLDGKTTLQIKGGNIPLFNEKITDQLATVTKLQLGSLEINEFFLKPNLLEVEAERNEINVVRFDPTAKYQIKVLKLNNNQLKELTGFEQLVTLTDLQLKSNKLESVDMKVFSGMTQLERLALDHNQIVSITTTEVVTLPRLDFLSLADNNIPSLDISKWKFDSLVSLDISGNDLVRVDGLNEHLVTLQSVTLARNAWHCLWLADTLKHFEDSSVDVLDRDSNCEGITSDNICCVVEQELGGTYEENFQQLDRLEKEQRDLQRSLTDQIDLFISEQGTKVKSMETRFSEIMLKQSTITPVAEQDNLFQNDFKSLKDNLRSIKASLEEQTKSYKTQNENNRRAQRQLRYSILELKRALERDTKKIADLQAQFGMLKDHVLKSPKRSP